MRTDRRAIARLADAIDDAIDETPARSAEDPPLPPPRATWIALAAWAGAILGTGGASGTRDDAPLGMHGALADASGGPPHQAWLAAAAVAALLSILAGRRRDELRRAILVLASVALLAAGWAELRSREDLAARIIAMGPPRPATVVGRIAAPPRGGGGIDLLAERLPRTRSILLPIDVESIAGAGMPAVDARGRIDLRLPSTAIPASVGGRIEARGILLGPRPSPNPGRPASGGGRLDPPRLGVLVVADPRLLRPLDDAPPPVLDRLRERLRAAGSESLRRALGADPDPEAVARRELLAALLLGERSGASFRGVREQFTAAGLAHLLAISGFNLAVIASLASAAAGLVGARASRRAMTAVAAVVLYLLVLPPAVPVLRAALAASIVSLAVVLRRRWDPRAATAIAAILLLGVAPGEARGAAFQLSFAAVVALEELAPRLRRRWLPPRRDLGDRASLLRSAMGGALVASTAAWLVSTPIALGHFGQAALLGVPATILASPLAAAAIVTAAAGLPASLVAPGLAPVVGSILDLAARLMIAVAACAERLPGSHLAGPAPPAAACVALLLASAWWLAAPRDRRDSPILRRPLLLARLSLLAAASSTAALLLPAPWSSRPDRVEVVALSVGDGAAIAVARGQAAILLDCGSGGDARAGSMIVEALRSLGIRRLEALVVSHPDLDHFSGAAEVLGGIPTDLLVVGEETARRARLSAAASERMLLAEARRRGVPVMIAAAGDEIGRVDADLPPRPLGLRARVVAPAPGDRTITTNDASLAVVLEDPRGGRPILATFGDLGGPRLDDAALEVGAEPLVAEVPHHGAADLHAVELLDAWRRTLWLRSCSTRRLLDDRLAAALGERARRAPPSTAEHGALRAVVALRAAGPSLLRLERHRGGWEAIDVVADRGASIVVGDRER